MDVAEALCAKDTPSGDPPPVFEIGLTAAGAVSAGAYTAGVLDLLFEAMDAFEAERIAGNPQVPTHRVALRAMVGASAGAMNAAIVAAWAQRDFPHPSYGDIDNALIRNANPFAWAWIDQPDIARLLKTDDMLEGTVPSLLNGAWLRDVVRQILSPPAQPKRREWLTDLRVRVTVGNLTGTPFELRFGEDPTKSKGELAGGMTDHGAVLDFLAVQHGLKPPSHYLTLPPDISALCPRWSHLGDAALASGAFPIALPARTLRRPQEQRPKRWVFVPKGDVEQPNAGEWKQLDPVWPDDPPNPEMCCVDGGIINNEPIELCREALLLDHGKRLKRDPAVATSSMIMIDPFPDPPASGEVRPSSGLPALASALIGAWTAQARYRPVDLMLAADDDSFSRQLIAPSADQQDRPAGAPTLAGAGLGGFLGFFHRDYRQHDYLLGRHNCRSFLQHHFTVPIQNPVVAPWALDPVSGGPTPLATQVMADHGLCQEDAMVPLVWLKPELRDPKPRDKPKSAPGAAGEAAASSSDLATRDPSFRDPEGNTQIATELAAATDKVRQPSWPKGRFEPARLRPAFAARARTVLRTFTSGWGFWWRAGAWLLAIPAAFFTSRKVVALLIAARGRSHLD